MSNKLLEEAIDNYDFENADGLPKHDLSKAIINEKTLFLIKKGWTFWNPPQNLTSNQEKSMMKDPKTNIGHHYVAGYELCSRPKNLLDFI